MSFAERLKDSVSNVFYDQISSNINFAKFIYTSLVSYSIEQWVFTICTGFILGLVIINSDPVSSKLLAYGKNMTLPAKQVDRNQPSVLPPKLYKYVDAVSNHTVPKKWFQHFYVFFTGLMLLQQFVFWNLENEIYPDINTKVKAVYETWYKAEEFDGGNFSMVYVINNMLLIQAFKRLYENYFISKFSNNRLNILHYLFGLGFYLFVCAVNFGAMVPFYINESNTDYHVNLEVADWLFGCVYLFYSVDQFQNHVHLASLKKYTVPTFRFFEWSASAHYFDEIVMYAVMLRFYLSCSGIFWLKLAFGAVFVLVVSNLGVSSKETYRYYQLKFDDFKIPYQLIPYVW